MTDEHTDTAETTASNASFADPLLLQTLICPLTRGPLTYDKVAGELISKKAGLAFPIREGVPIMLEDEARTLKDDE